MSKKSHKKPKKAKLVPLVATPADTDGIMPVIWQGQSLQEAQAIFRNTGCRVALRKALEKLFLAQCEIALCSDDDHAFEVKKGKKVHVIRVGAGGNNLRLAFAETDEKVLHVLIVWTKQNDHKLTVAEKNAIKARWLRIQ